MGMIGPAQAVRLEVAEQKHGGFDPRRQKGPQRRQIIRSGGADHAQSPRRA